MTAIEEAIKLEQFRELCRAYDRELKRFPEHEFEGWAFFQWLAERCGVILDSDAPEDWP